LILSELTESILAAPFILAGQQTDRANGKLLDIVQFAPAGFLM
jgi:hypothetical protein